VKNFRSLLMADVGATAGRVRLRRLAVHRHLPDLGEVERHRHACAQLLLYLTGRGTQEVRGRSHAVGPGTLVVLPAGTPHAFHRTAPRPPLCLALDFSGVRVGAGVARVPMVELREVRDALRRLAALTKDGQPQGIRASAEALGLLGRLLDAARPGSRPPPPGNLRTRLEHRLAEPGAWALPIAVLARRCGYQQDYLNRRIKEETGLTLNQFRARVRLEHARAVLAAGGRSAQAAEASGFEDVNYFTRWFRQQMGIPPAQWRRQAAAR
jgi:AraC family L-rhamnose operon transcriptional activator RhaR